MYSSRIALRFPRSKERGLIEAAVDLSQPGACGPFPRSKERGLIEAERIVRIQVELPPTFRVRKNAASLKLAMSARNFSPVLSFPRSKERGLIEADAPITTLSLD